MKKIQTITYAFLCAGAITLFMSFAGGGAKINAGPSAITSSAKLLHANATEDEAAPECNVPATPAAISGSPVVFYCPKPNITASYSIAPVAGATSYVWTVTGGSIVTINLSKTFVTVHWGLLAKSISVKAVNSCGSSGTRTLAITEVIRQCPF